MSEKKAINASTVARIAGNICGTLMDGHDWEDGDTAYLRLSIHVVKMARAIAAEVERTEPSSSIESSRPQQDAK